MQSVVGFFAGLGAWNWFILALVLLIAETIVPGAHIVWFGLAAAVMGLLGFTILPGLAIEWQLVLFGGLALFLIVIVRRFLGAISTEGDVPSLNERGGQYVGRLVTVEEPIAGGRGKVRIGDTLWQAEGPDTPKGNRVKVTGADGTVLRVSAV
jgi:inner membrane protein